PVLLGIVAAEFAPVVETPGLRHGVMETVFTNTDIRPLVVAQGEKITFVPEDQRRLVEPPPYFDAEQIAVPDIAEFLAVELTLRHGRAKPILRTFPHIERHQEGSVGSHEPLGTGVAGEVE